MPVPPILCVCGPSGSGKTSLLARLIPRLADAGLRVGAVKHCRHVQTGPGGKDSDRLAAAGAAAVVAAAADAVDARPGGEVGLIELAGTFCRGCDVVLAEGYAASVHDKVVLAAALQAEERVAPPTVRLRVGDGPGAVHPDDAESLAAWALGWLARRRAMRRGLLAAVLTGGASRRMGAEKARMRVAGRSVLGRLCELLADRIGRVFVVGRAGDPADAPFAPRVADLRPGLGPLGGIATALHLGAADDPPSAACVAACDMPALDGRMLDLLLAGRDAEAPATVPVHPRSGRLEPLCAIYEAAALTSVQAALDAGRLSVTDWLSAAGARRLAVPEELAGAMESVNTPQDLRLAEKAAGGNALPPPRGGLL